MRPHPTGCVYEWRFNRSALTIDPSAFAALLAGGGLNSSKNEYRVKACLEKERESAHDSQRWELHFRTANGRAERILSLAHPAVAARLLSCQANATLSFVGDSYLLQLFASLARALIEWTRRADGSFRWRNSRRASADMEAAVHDDVPTLHVLPHNLTLRFHRSNQFQTLSSVDPLHAAVGKRMRAEQLAVVPSQSFLRAIRPPCAHRYVVQTGAWFAITCARRLARPRALLLLAPTAPPPQSVLAAVDEVHRYGQRNDEEASAALPPQPRDVAAADPTARRSAGGAALTDLCAHEAADQPKCV
ncbi:hypothetical protein AB1Y20_001984 [Prymnesium parvum]|uniref:Uncharacterized protein n=1 Tax=Prymnesium parvum TaxID=97485 RepID=A0AB34JA74_PRYPA